MHGIDSYKNVHSLPLSGKFWSRIRTGPATKFIDKYGPPPIDLCVKIIIIMVWVHTEWSWHKMHLL